MALVNQNFRTLREEAGLTQTAFSELFGLTRAKVESYEKDTEPRIATLVAVADYFRIPLKRLVSDDLAATPPKSNLPPPPADAQVDAQVGAQVGGETQNKQYPFSSFGLELPTTDDPSGAYISGTGQRPPLVITVDPDDHERITLVREEAYAGYMAGYSDPDFVGTLPTFNLPGLTGRTFRAFQVRGNSMEAVLHPGDVVICSYVDDWRTIRNGRVHVVVSQSEGIVVKRIINQLNSTDRPQIVCQSENEYYKPFTLRAYEIAEIWQFQARISFELIQPNSLTEERLATLELAVEAIQSSLELAGIMHQPPLLGQTSV